MACRPRARVCDTPSACAAPRERVRLPERACGHKNSVPIFWLDQKGLYISHLIKHRNGLWTLCARLRLPERMCGSPSARAVTKIASRFFGLTKRNYISVTLLYFIWYYTLAFSKHVLPPSQNYCMHLDAQCKRWWSNILII